MLYSKLLYDIYMIATKQNQKFPFHFLSAPPTPPAEEKKKGKENFWFFYATEGSGRGAQISPRSDCFGKKFGFHSGDTAKQKSEQKLLAFLFGCGTWIRTKVTTFRESHPTAR